MSQNYDPGRPRQESSRGHYKRWLIAISAVVLAVSDFFSTQRRRGAEKARAYAAF